VYSSGKVGQWHQVLAIVADVDGVVIDRVLVSVDGPLQGIRCNRSLQGKTVVNPGFNLRRFLVVIPRHQLQIGQRLA
jgi:hypothetical protein